MLSCKQRLALIHFVLNVVQCQERDLTVAIPFASGAALLGGSIALLGAFALTQLANGYVLALFQVSSGQIVAYLLVGLLGVAVALMARGRFAAWYLLAILGFSLQGQIPMWGIVNFPDNFVHAGMAFVAMALSLCLIAVSPILILPSEGGKQRKF
jgi:hypothetical protein